MVNTSRTSIASINDKFFTCMIIDPFEIKYIIHLLIDVTGEQKYIQKIVHDSS